MFRPIVLSMAFLSAVTVLAASPIPKIIYDTDFGGDADDLGALAMLHNLVASGECELLGVAIWSNEEYSAKAVNAVNRFYGYPDTPIGSRKEEIWRGEWNYSKPIVDVLGSEISLSDIPDTTTLYRKLLSSQDDGSVTIVTVGPLLNIKRLLESPGDEYSPLSGKELFHRKVKEMVVMGGKFPSGEGEWNFDGNMPGVTKYVIENVNTPAVFSGYEVGQAVRAGRIFETLEETHPLRIGFQHFSQHAPWMKQHYEGGILQNPSYDQTAVLYAVRGGVGEYWEKIEDGRLQVDTNGDNRWLDGEESNHAYLKIIEPAERIEKVIEALMLGE